MNSYVKSSSWWCVRSQQSPWLKEEAFLNKSRVSRTLDTAHELRSLLNFAAPWNMLLMVVTPETARSKERVHAQT